MRKIEDPNRIRQQQAIDAGRVNHTYISRVSPQTSQPTNPNTQNAQILQSENKSFDLYLRMSDFYRQMTEQMLKSVGLRNKVNSSYIGILDADKNKKLIQELKLKNLLSTTEA